MHTGNAEFVLKKAAFEFRFYPADASFLYLELTTERSSSVMSANTRDSQSSSRYRTSRPRPRSKRSKSEVVCLVKLLNGEIFQCSVKVRPCRLL